MWSIHVKIAKKEETDDRPYTIKVKVAPLSVAIYSFTKQQQRHLYQQNGKNSEKDSWKSRKKDAVCNREKRRTS